MECSWTCTLQADGGYLVLPRWFALIAGHEGLAVVEWTARAAAVAAAAASVLEMGRQRRGSMANSEMSVPAGGGADVLLDPYDEVRRHSCVPVNAPSQADSRCSRRCPSRCPSAARGCRCSR